MDARRMGRIRLCASPATEPPISELGFDPILSMPTVTEFLPSVHGRTCPIKALLLDQTFSAGIGNWVADEVLYHARIHPEQRCNTLTDDQLKLLHHHIVEVCAAAVAVDADSDRFPQDWLFKHRWVNSYPIYPIADALIMMFLKGKGKKTTESGTLFLVLSSCCFIYILLRGVIA